ncbi:MAG: hypothetical protein ACKVTZ_14235, partial [Bacteroidia bacterium]
MKSFFIYLTIILLLLGNLYAQPPVGKCLEGNCKNGTGRYQLNKSSFYEGGFKKGRFFGQGKIYNPGQWSYTGVFDENGFIRQCKYLSNAYNDEKIRLRFEGTEKLVFFDTAHVNKNWQIDNFSEYNGKYFKIVPDSGRVSIYDPYEPDSTHYAYAGRFNKNGSIGKGKIYKNNLEADFDFSSVPADIWGDSLRIAIQSYFYLKEVNLGECLSGNCENGIGVSRLSKFMIYEGGFKNGKFSGLGKIGHDNGSWYFTGNFQENTILNYQYYEQQSTGSSPVLNRKATALIKYIEPEYAKRTLTIHNYYYNDKKFFKVETIDTVTWYFKESIYLKIAPDKRN